MSLAREEKLNHIKKYIQDDIGACDMKISLFVSAAKSYKQNFMLNPFPSFYIEADNTKNFDRLLEDVEKIPAIEELLVLLMAEIDYNQILNDSVINLLYWILVDHLKYDIQTVPKAWHSEILTLATSSGKIQIPNQIFKINYRENSAAERKFNQLKIGKRTKFAYHGTKFYCAYSILNYGLQQHLNKTALFGEGLYFAFELQVSLLFSPSVLSWSKSKHGDLISCVAICEYINIPNHIKIRKENAKNSDIPHSYLLIQNNEIVRVRYLLIYGSKKPVLKPSSSSSSMIKSASQTEISSSQLSFKESFFLWCRQNPLIVSACLYVLLLILVGMSNHRSFEHYKKIIMEFLKRRFKFE